MLLCEDPMLVRRPGAARRKGTPSAVRLSYHGVYDNDLQRSSGPGCRSVKTRETDSYG
jgi:hypothetical protein